MTVQKWAYVDREIIQIIPVTDFVAVYAEPKEDHVAFYSFAIEFLAVTKCTEHYCESHEGHAAPRDVVGEIYSDVTGLLLNEGGSFDITAECNNFCGICRVGDDITKVDDYLSHEAIKPLNWKSPRKVEQTRDGQ
jgi:hypothetical protein